MPNLSPLQRVIPALAGTSAIALCAAHSVARADEPFLLPNSLVISSTTYDRSQGAVASLTIGTTLANTESATSLAISGNDYINVWNNSTVDGSFGVTSPILLTDMEPFSGHVLQTLAVPTDQVVTPFPVRTRPTR